MRCEEIFGLMKTLVDAHTMGIDAAVSLLRECNYKVIVSPLRVQKALETLESEESQRIILDWIKSNKINHIGVSYRLDPRDAVNIFGRLVALLKKEQYFECLSANVKSIYFAGLKLACDEIEREYSGRICTFRGGESPEETLMVMGIPKEDIPEHIVSGCKYDRKIQEFGRNIIKKEEYKSEEKLIVKKYPEYATRKDTLVKRLVTTLKMVFNHLSGTFRTI